jgi:hypothetical protein
VEIGTIQLAIDQADAPLPEDGTFERAMQVAELDYIATSVAAQTCIAENYVGLPV